MIRHVVASRIDNAHTQQVAQRFLVNGHVHPLPTGMHRGVKFAIGHVQLICHAEEV